MKNKFFATLLLGTSIACSKSYAMPSGNPFFYIEANKELHNYDIRVPALAITGVAIAFASALFKLDVESREAFCKKNNIPCTKEAIVGFFKKLIPSSSSVLLLGGLLLAISSKNIVHFFDACFKCWALDQVYIYDNAALGELAFSTIKKSLS